MPMTYAVVRTGGKQYTVRPGATLKVEKLDGAPGQPVELTDVLLVAADDTVTVGRPTVPGARVLAEIVAHGKGEKVIVFKYKAKVRYRRKTGHRQPYTRLAIKEIVTS
jgi:large subunit ribosomal protein L21